MNQFAYIETACQQALLRGVTLVNDRSIFDWSDPTRELPKTCSAMGAVLLLHELHAKPDRWANLRRILAVEDGWLYRFGIGWSNLHGLLIVDHEFKVVGKDDVSHRAKAMAKRMLQC